jgi:pimeloyl-ACP methyl ester carboxylesterase
VPLRACPYDAEGLDWLAGFSQEAIDEVRLTLADRSEAREFFRKEREKIVEASSAQVALDMSAGTPGADLALLADKAVSMRQALAPGIEGLWDDAVGQLTPWGFDVARISVPVLLLHGVQDRVAPFGHGRWLASRIPGVETWSFDYEGHSLRENHIEDDTRMADVAEWGLWPTEGCFRWALWHPRPDRRALGHPTPE